MLVKIVEIQKVLCNNLCWVIPFFRLLNWNLRKEKNVHRKIFLDSSIKTKPIHSDFLTKLIYLFLAPCILLSTLIFLATASRFVKLALSLAEFSQVCLPNENLKILFRFSRKVMTCSRCRLRQRYCTGQTPSLNRKVRDFDFLKISKFLLNFYKNQKYTLVLAKNNNWSSSNGVGIYQRGINFLISWLTWPNQD